jgi:hypothetical protein
VCGFDFGLFVCVVCGWFWFCFWFVGGFDFGFWVVCVGGFGFGLFVWVVLGCVGGFGFGLFVWVVLVLGCVWFCFCMYG